MEKKDQVKELWHTVYDLVRGPGRVQTPFGNSIVHLPHNFDEVLMNDIAALQTAVGEDMASRIAAIRTRLDIAQSMGLIGSTDIERLHVMLDKLEG